MENYFLDAITEVGKNSMRCCAVGNLKERGGKTGVRGKMERQWMTRFINKLAKVAPRVWEIDTLNKVNRF